MRLKRKHIASLLLLAFVAGSQIAPFSHYLFMAASDAYPPFQGSETHQMAHETGGHAAHAAPATQHHEGAQLSAIHDHILCEYADLFATFAATDVDTASEILTQRIEVVSFEDAGIIVASTSTHTQSRAPPVQLV